MSYWVSGGGGSYSEPPIYPNPVYIPSGSVSISDSLDADGRTTLFEPGGGVTIQAVGGYHNGSNFNSWNNFPSARPNYYEDHATGEYFMMPNTVPSGWTFPNRIYIVAGLARSLNDYPESLHNASWDISLKQAIGTLQIGQKQMMSSWFDFLGGGGTMKNNGRYLSSTGGSGSYTNGMVRYLNKVKQANTANGFKPVVTGINNNTYPSFTRTSTPTTTKMLSGGQVLSPSEYYFIVDRPWYVPYIDFPSEGGSFCEYSYEDGFVFGASSLLTWKQLEYVSSGAPANVWGAFMIGVAM